MDIFKRISILLVGVTAALLMLAGQWDALSGWGAADSGLAPQGLVTITIDLEPVKDNTLYESVNGTLSNGKGQYVFVGQTGNSEIRRALLAFDVAGNIPSSATILTATLTLNMSKSIAGDTDIAVHTVQQDWGEGNSDAAAEEGGGAAAAASDATWIHAFFDTTLWAQPGGNFDPAAAATTTVGGPGAYSWQSVGLVADVQSWLAAPETNFGWILIGDESAAATAKRFDSHENSTVDNRPTLTITYSADLSQVFLPMAIAED
jgi:hypothetical protein